MKKVVIVLSPLFMFDCGLLTIDQYIKWLIGKRKNNENFKHTRFDIIIKKSLKKLYTIVPLYNQLYIEQKTNFMNNFVKVFKSKDFI